MIGALTLIAGMVTAPAASAAPADPGGFTATPLEPDGAPIDVAKSVSGRLAESDPALLARTDSALVTVMAKLDVDAAASYSGDVDGFAATSPQVTGKTLSKADPAVAKYLRHVGTETAEASKQIAATVPSAKVTAEFKIAYGGLAVQLPANQAKALLDIPGVVAVQSDKAETLQTDETPTFIGATKVWPSLGGSNKAGQGVIVGVHRLRHLARARLVQGPWRPDPGRWPLGLPVHREVQRHVRRSRRRQMQRQADRRLRVPGDQLRRQRRPPGRLLQRGGRVLGPRLQRPRHPHRVHRGR